MYLIHVSGVFLASILFGLCLSSIISYSINSAFALEVGSEVKANIGYENEKSKESSGDQSDVKASEDLSLKSESKSKSTIRIAYQKMTLDSKNSFEVSTERHLYNPGDEVQIEGSIWSNLVSEIGGVDAVKIQVVDNKGTVVYDDSVQVNNDGTYSTKFTLSGDSQKGAYTIKSNIELSADVLDTLTIDAQSNLQTSSKFVVANGTAFVVKAGGDTFKVNIASNSNIGGFEFKQDNKKLTFTVEGETGTQGVTQITIPKTMLSGQMSAMIDGHIASSDDIIVASDTETETTLEINYHHSMHTIDITGTNVVPEFPFSLMIMAVGSVAAVLLARSRMVFN